MLLTDRIISGIWLIFVGVFLGQAARSAELQSRVSSQIEGLRVADVMDSQPVAVSSGSQLDSALDEFFLRYGWPWFPVVDRVGHFLGLISRSEVEAVPEPLRATRTVEEVMTRDSAGTLHVGTDEPLEGLLASHTDGLRRLGAVMAVDREGILRGVVTLDRVRRALQPATPAA